MDENVISEGISKLYEKLESWVEAIIKMLPNMILAALVIALFWVLSMYVYKWITRLFQTTEFNKNLEHLLANFSRIAVIALGFIMALAILQLQKTVFSLLAGLGVVGLALGFAFKDLAANFISGVMLAVRSPLKIDDVIEISGVMGKVISVRLRDTIIQNFDGQDIFIPNKEFTSNSFTNYSSFGRRRIRIDVGIGYENDPQKALEIIVSSLKDTPEALNDPAPEAYVTELSGSTVNLCGYVWHKYPGGSHAKIKSDAIAEVKKRLEAAGFNLPFPIRTIDLSESTKKALFKQN